MNIKSKIFPVVAQMFMCLALVGIVLVNVTMAKTFTVNSGFDVNDLLPGNGICVAYLTIRLPFVFPNCTLRAAIEETNALPGEDVIILPAGTYRFNISGLNEDQAATGDLDITDSLQIIGAGVNKTFIDADGLDRVFDILGDNISVVLSNLTIRNGNLPADQPVDQKGGGGLRNLSTVSIGNIVLSGNSVFGKSEGDVGGGILNRGTCSIINSTIKNNYANEGGGIFNTSHSTLNISSSTIQGNFSQGGGGLKNNGSSNLTNTTLSNNDVQDGLASGGAVYNTGQLQLVHCTIAENSAEKGGGLCNDGGTIPIFNTLIADNHGGNCDSSGKIISEGYNLDSDNTCGLSSLDLTNIDPQLGPLQNNGGYTETHGLKPGSLAIDAGQFLPDVTTDQRGISRLQRKPFDIGAFESFNVSIIPFLTPLLFE